MEKQLSCVAELTRCRAEKTMIAKKKKKTHTRITTENNKKNNGKKKHTLKLTNPLRTGKQKKWKHKGQLCNYTYSDTVYVEVQ